MGSSLSDAGQTLKKMPGALSEDIKIGLGRMEPTEGFKERTIARQNFEKDQAESRYGSDNNPAPRQSTMARAAPRRVRMRTATRAPR